MRDLDSRDPLADPLLALDDLHSFRVQVALLRLTDVRRVADIRIVEPGGFKSWSGAAARPNKTEET
jgi:hypothetical protein